MVRATAEHLPFDDDAFDAAMAILTIHHWPDKEAGLREMRRVQSGSSAFWAIADVAAGLGRLKQHLETGEWERRYAELLALDAYDAGYRLVAAE